MFSKDFRKGYDGLTLEQRKEIFGDDLVDEDLDEGVDASQQFRDGEDITDYDVEAVVDEDQLFE